MIDVTEVVDDRTGERVLEVPLWGRLLLDCSLLNKGSAFSEQERRDFGLVGLLPSHVSTLEEQATRRYEEYLKKTTALERFLFLRALQDRNETLFYRLLQDHLTEMLPIIYTPEVGEVCQRYSHIYHRSRGLFISYPQRQEMDTILANRPYRQVDVIVATDGERILGLGDQGVGAGSVFQSGSQPCTPCAAWWTPAEVDRAAVFIVRTLTSFEQLGRFLSWLPRRTYRNSPRRSRGLRTTVPPLLALAFVYACAYTSCMDYEWDKAKARGNRKKHGVSLADAVVVLEDEQAITVPEDNPNEERFITIGMDAFGHVLVVVYTWRGEETIRIISARKATRAERQQYEEG